MVRAVTDVAGGKLLGYSPVTGVLPIGEAIVLGLASGPACLASCGPVVVPSLLSERTGWRANLGYLSAFLATRFLGYVIFAAVAWQVGRMASLAPAERTPVYGIVHVLLAAALLWYAWSVGRGCARECTAPELVTIGKVKKHSIPGAALLGLLTGISLCPPFVAAGVRAAELGSLAGALLFFAVFFFGTAVWFLPFLSFSCIKRNEAVVTVARMAMVLIALYYGFVGVAMLAGRNIHG